LFSVSFSGVKVEMDQAPVKSPLPVPGGEPPSTLYQAPTEPVVLAPLVESVDLKQQQIDSLQEQVKWLKETLAKLNPSP